MVDCRDGSSNMVQRLGNVVSSVIVSLRRNKWTNGTNWPADAVFTRHRFVSASSESFFDTPGGRRGAGRRQHADAGVAADEGDGVEHHQPPSL